LDQVILDCVAGLHKLEQSMLEQICHYIVYGKYVMVPDDLNR